ncbi:MAG: hypothetical protein K0U52_05095, partial [Gammaproteobacteria bacterium]|nr:hypothetical protein [Gammaproteobacteria bacterium]
IAMNHTDIEVPEQINATVRTDHLASQSVLKYAGFIIDETTETSEKFGNARYEVSRNIVDFIAACEAALPAKTESIYDSAHTIFRSNAGNAASVERTSVSNTM